MPIQTNDRHLQLAQSISGSVDGHDKAYLRDRLDFARQLIHSVHELNLKQRFLHPDNLATGKTAVTADLLANIVKALDDIQS